MSRWWVRAAVSVAVAAIMLTFVPVGRVWSAIVEVNPWVWAASVGVFGCGHSMNALKLRVLLGSRAASASACLRAQFAGITANLGLPGVVGGDVVRAAYLAPVSGASRVAVAAVTDRIVDALALLLIVVIAGARAGFPPVTRGSGSSGGWWLAAIVLAIAGLAVAGRRRLRRTRAWPRVREAFSGILEHPWAIGLALAISLGVQSTFVFTNVWLASEVGLTMALAPWFLAWTAAKLGALLPISLGGIGVREATLVSVLAAYGAPADAVLATGLLWEGAMVVGSVGGFIATQVSKRHD
jgi:uncharacterized membrane protein YbhN (UPF0104 family)